MTEEIIRKHEFESVNVGKSEIDKTLVRLEVEYNSGFEYEQGVIELTKIEVLTLINKLQMLIK